VLPNDLEHRIHQAILQLNDANPYEWADVIHTLVDCKKELQSWVDSVNSSYDHSYRSTLDVYADQ
jgi:hypothetical protein